MPTRIERDDARIAFALEHPHRAVRRDELHGGHDAPPSRSSRASIANAELADSIGASNSTSSSACCHASSLPAERRPAKCARAVSNSANERSLGIETRTARARAREPPAFVDADVVGQPDLRGVAQLRVGARRGRDNPGRTSGTRCPASPRAARGRAASHARPRGATRIRTVTSLGISCPSAAGSSASAASAINRSQTPHSFSSPAPCSR